MKEYLEKLKYAKTEPEVDQILDEIVPILKSQGVSPAEIMMYFKMGGNDFDFVPKTQDHRMTHSNAGKAQEIMRKLMAKLKE
ncbi:hypothetical protein [uncultured Tenacibaculum sp.]|uniref:hypothetical protein n=1 Tax=uncultured Tenacibaculum sp. TaxID=174713 RepID=UPI0026086E07|nr:hypothetical protein [uncultured Tenacibaculum sp.]